MDAAASAPPVAPKPAPIRTWPHSVRTCLFVVVLSCIVGLLTRSLLQGSVQRPVAHPGEPLLTRLELNHATVAELQLLPGVGENMARRIDAYRFLYGPYASVDELRKVPGIGQLTIERLRPWLHVVPAGNSAAAQAPVPLPDQRASAKASVKAASLGEPIDLNTAGLATLQKLPGIGPKLSQRIVDVRAQAPFKSVDDLRRVPGIGPKTIANLRPLVTIGSGAAGQSE